MPKVLTITQKPEESTEEFANRIADQANSFFGGSPAGEPKSTGSEGPVDNETSTAPGDVLAVPEGVSTPPD